jgi:molybdopterin converting factor small subunit
LSALADDFPTIRVELFGVPRLRAGVGRLDLRAATVEEALRALERACPGLVGSVLVGGRLHPAYRLNLNGERFLSDTEQSPTLRSGDCLILLAADAGG